MRYKDLPDATVIVDKWSSECNNCSKSCSWISKTHDVILGWGEENGSPGCGIEWTHAHDGCGGISSDIIRRERPDLILI